ncbi:protein of unknown function [Paraburkholderia dioscoreae]|uniref:Uncharacterized protein n=1 Tax=Paraburkholderia dioscoreae TaxID=2604047 RepID=A0A5Q4ZVN5_9BURK|nr:protein of unknown function [Paraburkholderia dioscoreae]
MPSYRSLPCAGADRLARTGKLFAMRPPVASRQIHPSKRRDAASPFAHAQAFVRSHPSVSILSLVRSVIGRVPPIAHSYGA